MFGFLVVLGFGALGSILLFYLGRYWACRWGFLEGFIAILLNFLFETGFFDGLCWIFPAFLWRNGTRDAELTYYRYLLIVLRFLGLKIGVIFQYFIIIVIGFGGGLVYFWWFFGRRWNLFRIVGSLIRRFRLVFRCIVGSFALWLGIFIVFLGDWKSRGWNLYLLLFVGRILRSFRCIFPEFVVLILSISANF